MYFKKKYIVNLVQINNLQLWYVFMNINFFQMSHLFVRFQILIPSFLYIFIRFFFLWSFSLASTLIIRAKSQNLSTYATYVPRVCVCVSYKLKCFCLYYTLWFDKGRRTRDGSHVLYEFAWQTKTIYQIGLISKTAQNWDKKN